MKRIALLTIVILLVACSPKPDLPTNQPATTEPTPTVEVEMTEAPVHIPEATTEAVNVPAYSLGAPFFIGRGWMNSAEILTGGQHAVIGQDIGISLISLADGSEVWWYPTDVPVSTLVVHPNGSTIAAMLADGSILILDTATGAALNRIPIPFDGGYGKYSEDMTWSPDGTRLAVHPGDWENGDFPVYLLEMASGAIEAVRNTDSGTSFMWSADSRLILRQSYEGCDEFIDAATGQLAIPIVEGQTCIYPWDWVPGSSVVLAGTESGYVWVDANTGVITGTLPNTDSWGDSGRSFAMSEDGSLLVGNGSDVRIWDIASNTLIATLNPPGRSSGGDRFDMHFDGETLVSIHTDEEITRWDFGSGAQSAESLGYVPLIVAKWPATWSADSRLMATSSDQGGVLIWSVASGELLMRLDGQHISPAFSHDGQRVAVIDADREELVVIDLASGAALLTLPEASGLRVGEAALEDSWSGVAFSPDDRWLAYRYYTQVIIVDAATGERVSVLDGHDPDLDIVAIRWSPAGNAIATVAGRIGANCDACDTEFIVWAGQDGRFAEIFSASNSSYWAASYAARNVRFNPSGSLVTIDHSQEDADEIAVIDTRTGELIQTLTYHFEVVAWLSDDVLMTLIEDIYSSGDIMRIIRNVRTDEVDEIKPSRFEDARTGQPNAIPSFLYDGLGTFEIVDWYEGEYIAYLSIEGYTYADFFSWSPDKRWLAADLPEDGLFAVWPVLHGQ